MRFLQKDCQPATPILPLGMRSTKDIIVDQLEAARIKRGITPTKLAETIGVHPYTVTRMMEGRSGITSTNLIAMAQALGFRVVLVRERR